MKIQRIDTQRDDVEHALGALRERLSPRGEVVSEAGRARTVKVFGQPLSPQEVVERICGDVRRQGLDALLRYTLQLDDASLDASTIRVSTSELEEAHETADPQFLATIRAIRENILEFQQEILCRDIEVVRPHGGFLRQRYAAFERVGICVPGGAAAYPSTVLMTAIPAQAAGVPQLAVVAPPTQFGAYNTDLLATCHELGIAEVYRVGGAQGVAAMAYGVDGIAKVDKIVGPGNLFVALAKKLVYGDVDIDSIAGPSEVVVIADKTARPEFVAADLLAQAEHAPGASILVTWDRSLLESVDVELSEQVTRLGRSELTVERGRPGGQPDRTRTFTYLRRICRGATSQDSKRRSGVSGELHSGCTRRLRRRSVPRSAHRRNREISQRPVRQRLSQKWQRHPLYDGRAEGRSS